MTSSLRLERKYVRQLVRVLRDRQRDEGRGEDARNQGACCEPARGFHIYRPPCATTPSEASRR